MHHSVNQWSPRPGSSPRNVSPGAGSRSRWRRFPSDGLPERCPGVGLYLHEAEPQPTRRFELGPPLRDDTQPSTTHLDSTVKQSLTRLFQVGIFSNETLNVVIQSKDGTALFKGFLLMAIDEKTNRSLGQFRASGDGKSQLLSCYDEINVIFN